MTGPLDRRDRGLILIAWTPRPGDDVMVLAAKADLDSYEATVQAAEARIEALRTAALQAAISASEDDADGAYTRLREALIVDAEASR